MKIDISEKKKEITDYLSILFVDDYDYFIKIIDKINKIFHKYNIDYKYDYNTYCQMYIKKCHQMLDNDPTLDFIDNESYTIHGIVTASMVDDIRKNNTLNDRK